MTGPSNSARARSLETRRATAEVLGAVRAGELPLGVLLTSPAHSEHRTKIANTCVQRVLRVVPGIGSSAIVTICRRAEVDRLTRMSALSPVRRQMLADATAAELDLDEYSGSGPRRKAST